MTYYIYIKDDKILCGAELKSADTSIKNLVVDEAIYRDFEINKEKYIWDGEKLVLDPEYEEKQFQKEQERINGLTMTALDFINVLKQTGLTAQEIKDYLNDNVELEQQLTYCQNVFCGVVRQLLPLKVKDITITDDMIVKAFKVKNGEEVIEEKQIEDIEQESDIEDMKLLMD